MDAAEVDATRLMTAAEVANRLNISIQTVHNYRRRGVLPGIKLGYKVYRFEPAAIARFLRERGATDAASNP